MKYILFFLGLIVTNSFAQVGIGTTTPSSAAVLHLESLNTETGAYGGLMLPVINLIQRDLIPVTVIDDGLMIYLVNGTKPCLQIYNATANSWVNHCASASATTNTGQGMLQQDFDSNTCWRYMSNIPYFQDIPNESYYDVTDGSGFPLLTLTNNFFGARDYEEYSNPSPPEARLTFYQVDVSEITTATLTFDFDSVGFIEVGFDYFGYQVFHDSIGQGYVSICDGCNNGLSGTISVAIPDTVSDFHIVIIVSNEDDSDYVGFDNFLIQ